MVSQKKLENVLLELLGTGHHCKTPSDLFSEARRYHPDAGFLKIRTALKSLLCKGSVIYSHQNGATQLELNYGNCLMVSDRLLIRPVHQQGVSSFDGAVLYLASGTAFGDGYHPTTRLCLRALDYIIQSKGSNSTVAERAVLDIGTGSGILAIAAVLLGFGSALGLDTDSAACHEARQNVVSNGLDGRVRISNQPLEEIENRTFDLLLANLRPPTLKHLFPLMRRFTGQGGTWLLSGFRPEEKDALFSNLERSEGVFWQAAEHDWAAVAVSVGGCT